MGCARPKGSERIPQKLRRYSTSDIRIQPFVLNSSRLRKFFGTAEADPKIFLDPTGNLDQFSFRHSRCRADQLKNKALQR